MAKKRYYNPEMYAGYEGRNRMEAEDSGMIHEDRSAIANLPQNVMMKEYPKTEYYHYDLDDTQAVINKQIDDDVRGGGRRKANEKYPEKY